MKSEFENRGKELLVKFISSNLSTTIQPMYYDDDYNNMDLSNISDPDAWEKDLADSFVDEDEDEFAQEIYQQRSGFSPETGDEIAVHDEDIDTIYLYVYNGCEDMEYGEVAYTVLFMKDGTILLGNYSGD